ncbi:MAG: OmpA family protein [Pseudomonadales bacterium]
MARPPLPREPAGDDRWLVSYADFVTLLFAFFVVMYAVARSNQVELAELSQTLSATFAAEPRALQPIQVGDPLLAASPHVVDSSADPGYADQEPGDSRIEPTVDRLQERFAGLDGIETPRMASDKDWLEISLPSELLFAPGDASLRPDGEALLEELAAFLAEFDNPVTVEGYTDNVPVNSSRFPSNWELSAFRASVVARFFEARGIERSRIAAVGYGENHPAETNATPGGRARNRRVDVIVARKGNSARNRNAAEQGSAFAHVRHAVPLELDDAVERRRTPEGGLLFSNEPARSE